VAPLLKCLEEEEAEYAMNELHNGVCGNHSDERTMASRVLRVRYDCDEDQGERAPNTQAQPMTSAPTIP